MQIIVAFYIIFFSEKIRMIALYKKVLKEEILFYSLARW